MAMAHIPWWQVGCAVLCLVGVRGAAAAEVAPADREKIRAQLKLLWDSWETIEFGCENYELDADGRSDRREGFIRYDFVLGSAGRRVQIETAVRPEGEERMSESHDDGRRVYCISYFPRHPSVIDRVDIVSSKSAPDTFSGVLVGPLWAFMPERRPLYVHLDAGAKLESAHGADGKELFRLHIQPQRGPTVHCELDPDHDWLARRVEVPRDSTVVTVTRFRRENGRWFPAEVTESNVRDGERQRTGYTVTDLRINRPVPISTFGPPQLPAGVMIVDHTQSAAGIASYQGGKAAREQLERKYAQDPRESVIPRRPIVASPTPSLLPISAMVAIASLAIIGLAVWLRRRHSRPSG